MTFLPSFMKTGLRNVVFYPIRGFFPPELLAKRFALVSKRHSKNAKDVTNCNKMFWLCYKINTKWFSGKFSGMFFFVSPEFLGT